MHPFPNPDAEIPMESSRDETELATLMSGASLLRLDALLSEAIMHDAVQSWSRHVTSQKVVPNSGDLQHGFSRLRLLPRYSDKPSTDDPSEESRTFVKLPNNVLFGVREIFAFVPNQGTEEYRDAEFLFPLVAALITYDEDGGRNVYIFNEHGMNEVTSLAEIIEALSAGDVTTLLPGMPISNTELERLHRLMFDSAVVDQDDREPLVDV